jgi:hypothetical protein
MSKIWQAPGFLNFVKFVEEVFIEAYKLKSAVDTFFPFLIIF